jgi:hypothetical protein
MNNTTFFHHIDPSQTVSPLLPHMQMLSQGGEPLANAIRDAGDLANAAMVLFCGIFPRESPYFFWGEGEYLPWHRDYAFSGGGNDQQRAALLAEINAIVGELRRLAGPVASEEPSWPLTYQSKMLCESKQLIVQGLIVETLLCLDGLLERLAGNRPIDALAWQANAYRNLIEALSHVLELLRSHKGAAAVSCWQ